MLDTQAIVSKSSQLRILYVEDEKALLEETKVIFDDIFKEVDTAINGEEALKLYKLEPNKYDIIITDLNMPKMNGLELIKNVKELNTEQAIIALSAHNETEYFLDSIHSGINGYVLKPFDFETFFITLSKVMKDIEGSESKQQSEDQNVPNEANDETLCIDEVTQLPNNLALYKQLEEMSKQEKECTLFLLNIDNFLHINHLLGYQKSEDFFKTLMSFLQRTTPRNSTLYKYDMDKFALLVKEPMSIETAKDTATFLLAFFKETPIFEFKDINIYINFSIGIALNSEASTSISKAKVTLMEIKSIGAKGYYAIYSDKHDVRLSNKEEWMAKIRKALEKDHIYPFYQPIIDSKTNQIIFYEALARIQDEESIITPDYFLEAIRDSGLNRNLTRVMIGKVFEEFRNNTLSVSINITSDDLIDSMFIDYLLIKCEKCNIKPSRVYLEILETSVLSGSLTETIFENIQTLKTHGFKISLDDFGSEFSNFSRLKKIAFDVIKIDGAYIKNIDKNIRKQQIVSKIIQLAHDLHIPVVAEHVGTKPEYEMIKSLDANLLQGNFLYPASRVIF